MNSTDPLGLQCLNNNQAALANAGLGYAMGKAGMNGLGGAGAGAFFNFLLEIKGVVPTDEPADIFGFIVGLTLLGLGIADLPAVLIALAAGIAFTGVENYLKQPDMNSSCPAS
jgi:hypothetical protein